MLHGSPLCDDVAYSSPWWKLVHSATLPHAAEFDLCFINRHGKLQSAQHKWQTGICWWQWDPWDEQTMPEYSLTLSVPWCITDWSDGLCSTTHTLRCSWSTTHCCHSDTSVYAYVAVCQNKQLVVSAKSHWRVAVLSAEQFVCVRDKLITRSVWWSPSKRCCCRVNSDNVFV